MDVLEVLKEKADGQLSDLRKAETNTRHDFEFKFDERSPEVFWNRELSQSVNKAFWNLELSQSVGKAFLNPELSQSVAKLSAVIA